MAFSKESHFVKHQNTHSRERRHQCSQCDKNFSFNSQLITHMRTHTGEKPFKCSNCDKAFAYNQLLKRHLRTHFAEKTFQCRHCDKAFEKKSHLKLHMRTHDEEKVFQCSYCNTNFSKNSKLKKHLRTHTGEKQFQCKQCDKCFLQNSSLMTHLKIHSGDKPYQCSYCDKNFSINSYLICHLRTHTGEKPFQCSNCDKSFSQKSSLTTHLMTHTGKKPYQCSHCDKAFTAKQDLVKHYIIHPGKKPHKCSQCNKAYSKESTLIRHLRKHTGKNPFQCNDCDKVFPNKKGLSNHMREHTEENPCKYGKGRIKTIKSSRDENKEKYMVNNSNICNEKGNKFKENELELNEKECLQANVNSDKKSKSPSHECEEMQQTKHFNDTKKENKRKKYITESDKENEKGDPQSVIAKDKKLISNTHIDKQFFEKIKEGLRKTNNNIEIFRKETLIEVITLSDDEDETERSPMDDVLFAIDKVFDLIEESTEGIWKRSPNQIEQNLYDVLQSLKLKRFESSWYSNIYNLDVNYRQMFIYYSGVDFMVLKHAWLCKQSYPNCKDIPYEHQEDMDCCTSKQPLSNANIKPTFTHLQPLAVMWDKDGGKDAWYIGFYMGINPDDTVQIDHLVRASYSKDTEWIRPSFDDIQDVQWMQILPIDIIGDWDISKRKPVFRIHEKDKINEYFKLFI